jgi:ribosomal protein L40E
MPEIRHPVAGFVITILGSTGLSFLAALPLLFLTPLTQREIVYFYLPFALFAVGMFAGRSGFLGSLGFIGATMGGFIGTYAFQALFIPRGWPLWPADWTILLTLAFGAACGAGGLAMGKLGMRRVEQITQRAPKMRRCLKCGAKVGMAARKCWSCRAYLPPT